MLQGILVKKVLDLVLKQIFKQFDLNKINKYVEEDNALDVQMKQAYKLIDKQGRTIESNEKEIAILKKEIKKLKKEKYMLSMLTSNWEWFLLALYVLEKGIKLSPSKKDDLVWDMVLKPIVDKIKGK